MGPGQLTRAGVVRLYVPAVPFNAAHRNAFGQPPGPGVDHCAAVQGVRFSSLPFLVAAPRQEHNLNAYDLDLELKNQFKRPRRSAHAVCGLERCFSHGAKQQKVMSSRPGVSGPGRASVRAATSEGSRRRGGVRRIQSSARPRAVTTASSCGTDTFLA